MEKGLVGREKSRVSLSTAQLPQRSKLLISLKIGRCVFPSKFIIQSLFHSGNVSHYLQRVTEKLGPQLCTPANQEKERHKKSMKKQLSMLVFVVLGAAVMYGQATRTWVSGVGDDANPCSRTAPCKTFAGAISKTAPGGEIDALDPGGFGALTITKPITLDGGGGQVASVLVAGTNGIVVAAGAGDTVIIRNLRLDGLACSTPAAPNCTGSPGLNGIRWISGKFLHIENCTVFGFSNTGIDIEKSDGVTGAQAFISGSVVTNDGVVGLFVKNTSPVVQVTFTNSISKQNSFGIAAQDFSSVSVFNSEVAGNSGVGVQVSPAAGSGTASVYNSTIAHNAVGLTNGGAGTATANISGVAFLDNGAGIAITSGTVNSAGNNYVTVPVGSAPNGTLTKE